MTFLSRRPNAGRNEYTVIIDRPPAEVFPWLTEPYRLTRWIGGLESSTPISGDSVVRGARSREIVLAGKKRYAFITEITDVRKDSMLAVQITSEPKGYTVNALYELSPAGTGTQLRYVGQADYAGVFARVMEPLVTPQSQRKIKTDMLHLKELIEAQPGPPGI
jgi:uncharacterized protein YndB with AHSA1/START domain